MPPGCEPECPYSKDIGSLSRLPEQVADLLRKIDRMSDAVFVSSVDRGSIVDQQRKHEAQIRELAESVKGLRGPTLLDHAIRSMVGAICNVTVTGIILLLCRGIIAQILKGTP